MAKKKQDACHYCGKQTNQSGENFLWIKDHLICESCISVGYQAISEIRARENTQAALPVSTEQPLPAAKEIRAFLDRHIIGQDRAKRALSVAVANHYRRLNNPLITQKSNVLLFGPTGSGKTELARTTAKFLKVPFIQVDATTFTPRGYIGESVDSIIERLLSAAGGDPKLAERGIVFIDEMDKVPQGDGTQFKAKAIQQELLRIVEGDIVEVKASEDGMGHQKVPVDTSNILFIAGGAFVGLEEIVSNRTKEIGITSLQEAKDNNGWADRVESKHMTQFGFIPEFLGRFPVITHTVELTEADLARVLTDTENSIVRNYQSLAEADKVQLRFSSDIISEIARRAKTEGLGARGLKKHIDRLLEDFFYNIDDYRNQTITFTTQGPQRQQVITAGAAS